MKHRILQSKHLLLIAMASVALVACSGGDNGDGLTETQRQDQGASESVTGLVNFAAGQIGTATSETGEPRSIAGITPPADETSEPFVL